MTITAIAPTVRIKRFGDQHDPAFRSDEEVRAVMDAHEKAVARPRMDGFEERPLAFAATAAGEAAPIGLATGYTIGAICRVDALWVRPDQRHRGIGAVLLHAADAVARERGCAVTQVTMYDGAGPGFLEKRGFARIGYYPDLVKRVGSGLYQRHLGDAVPTTPALADGISVSPSDAGPELFDQYSRSFAVELDGGVEKADRTLVALLDGPAGFALGYQWHRRGSITAVFAPEGPDARRALLAALEADLAAVGVDTVDLFIMNDEQPEVFLSDGYREVGRHPFTDDHEELLLRKFLPPATTGQAA